MDLSAFLSTQAPAEEPPPYTEQALEGHITLLVGGKSPDADNCEEEESTANYSHITTRDVSILERSQQSINHPEGNPENATFTETPNFNAAGSDTTARDFNNVEIARDPHQVMMGSSPRNAARVSSPSMDCYNPFLEIPVNNIESTDPAPLFQRPVRSHSSDNSTEIHPQEHLIAGGYVAPIISQFPPPRRLSPPNSNNREEVDLNLRHMPPLTTRRIPTRLPPLPSSAERIGRRHKHKRRRGHSWHGESNVLVTASTMTTVTE